MPTALVGESLDVTGDTVTAGGSSATIVGAVDAGNGVMYLIDSVLLPTLFKYASRLTQSPSASSAMNARRFEFLALG